MSSALVFSDGVKHERHSSSVTAGAMVGKSGDPFPSIDINWRDNLWLSGLFNAFEFSLRGFKSLFLCYLYEKQFENPPEKFWVTYPYFL